VIDATPGAVKDWAIRTFGENDKILLLGGIFSAIALLACLTGIIAWRSRPVALGLTAILGVVGVAAALVDPTELVGAVSKIAPAVAALIVCVAMLAFFTRGWSTRGGSTRELSAQGARTQDSSMEASDQSTTATALEPTSVQVSAATSSVRTPAITDAPASAPDFLQTPMARPKPGRPVPTGSENSAPAGFDRRAFLAAALASGAVATVGVGTSRIFGDAGSRSRDSITLPKPADGVSSLKSAAQLKVDGLTPYITPTSDFYRVDTALSLPQIDAGNWSLKIHGMVDDEITLSFEDLLGMPLIERRITLACVSNEIGGQYAGNATWLGVRISDLLDQVGYSGDADAIKSTSVDGMTIGTPIAALVDRDAMIAIGMNGQPLPIAHGFPARMVVPGLYGYVSATKWLVDMEVTRFADFAAYWTDRGFDAEAPIKTFSRIDVPKAFAQLTTGKNAIAGVAWAQATGIEKVEVSIDGGGWQQAKLAEEDSIDTWRQWVYEWEAEAGSHRLEVRSADKSGYTQTSRRVSPRPNGATGWHSVNVSVA
ncbi:MAG: molybdopterin-dependent oxidoreductase, partial [Nocardioidaceae bacterium]|nr:molybdopterin-dependent oxidoreductase [Nocardioidaceae bacterium]